MSDSEANRIGSGWLATLAATALIASGVGSVALYFSGVVYTFPKLIVYAAYAVLAGLVIIVWGINRIKKPRKEDAIYGQPTMNFVFTVVGVTFAVIAILVN